MKLNKIEIIFFVLLCVVCYLSFAVSAADEMQQVISSKVIRLHVVANSDSNSDQSVKIAVRDNINCYLEDILSCVKSKKEGEEILRDNLDIFKTIADNTLKEHGFEYCSRVEFFEEIYPTREYESVTLPSGEYLSLKIILGNGDGQNWWCVVFPPMCYSASEETLTELNFTDDELELITSDSNEVILKLKLLEYVNAVRRVFSR